MPDNPGKYFAKYYGQDEFEINPDASSVYLAVYEGLLITKYRYNRFHLIEGTHWNRKIQTSAAYGA